MGIHSGVIQGMNPFSHSNIVHEPNREVGSEPIKPVQVAVEPDFAVITTDTFKCGLFDERRRTGHDIVVKNMLNR
jgi:hypothetical protein